MNGSTCLLVLKKIAHKAYILGFSLLWLVISCDLPEGSKLWTINDPIFLPGEKGTFDEVAVKDPSIVYFEGQWHLFYTARGLGEYTTGYVSANNLSGLQEARRHELKMIRGHERYGCAPQVFYFEPQQKWYLIFQNKDANYQPAYSMTSTLNDPNSWTNSLPLLLKDESDKWIDFWIIGDEDQIHLFYTKAHGGVIRRSTSISNFPYTWGEGHKVFEGVHEAVHIYKVKGKKEYHMIYELNHSGVRSFGLAKAYDLIGPWIKVSDYYASGNQLKFKGVSMPWTEMVSHGEAIRSGYDQRMEYNPADCQWIIQGILKDKLKVPYPSLPWKLGLMEKPKIKPHEDGE